MKKNITVIKGDGIGPEIVSQAMRVLDKIAEKHGHTFHYTEILQAAAPSTRWANPCRRKAWRPA